MDGRIRDQTFKTFIDRDGVTDMLDVSLKYVEGFEDNLRDGLGILLYGGVGGGKTHLASAICNELIFKKRVVFANVPDLLSKIRATFSGTGNSQEIMDKLENCTLLVLDDIGAEKWTDWVEQTLYTIVNYRYNHKKPIIYTTNCSLKQLEDQAGYRALDRIIETSHLVECKVSSYRRQIAMARMGK